MKNLLKYIFLGIALSIGLAGCSGSNEEIPADTAGAYERGQSDAKALSNANYSADKDLHAALLAVKSREWQLRERGDAISADAYIEGFKAYLQENDKSLANKIF